MCISLLIYLMFAFHGIKEWFMLEETSGDDLVQPEAGRIRAGSSGTCPVEFWASSRMETTQPQWATCSNIWPPSHGNIFPCISSPSPVFQLVSIAFHPITANLQEVDVAIKSPWAFFFGLKPSSPSFSSYIWSSPQIILVALRWTHYFKRH